MSGGTEQRLPSPFLSPLVLVLALLLCGVSLANFLIPKILFASLLIEWAALLFLLSRSVALDIGQSHRLTLLFSCLMLILMLPSLLRWPAYAEDSFVFYCGIALIFLWTLITDLTGLFVQFRPRLILLCMASALSIWIASSLYHVSFLSNEIFVCCDRGCIRMNWIIGSGSKLPWQAKVVRNYFGAPSSGWFFCSYSKGEPGLNRPDPGVQLPTFRVRTIGNAPVWYSELVLPLWMLLSLAAVPGAISFLLLLGRRRYAPDHCYKCRYILRANTTGICPECGTAIPPEQMERIRATEQEIGGCP